MFKLWPPFASEQKIGYVLIGEHGVSPQDSLDTQADQMASWSRTREGGRLLSQRRKLLAGLLVASTLILSFTIVFCSTLNWPSIHSLPFGESFTVSGLLSGLARPADTAVDDTGAIKKRMHLLLPATEGSDYLCKTLFTAAANGYPTPVLINWGMKPTGNDTIVSHLKKVSGVKNYLESLEASSAEDLVLMTDAYDVWFQLPAEVMISRYHDILRQENERIRKQFGQGALDHGIHGRVVFAADKDCVGFSRTSWQCWAQPESSLPTSIYGDRTDTESGYFARSSFRPRWLNSGVVMGPVADVLAIFRTTEAIIEATLTHSSYYQSDQRVLGDVFAAQEIARMNKTLQNPTWLDGQLPQGNPIAPYGSRWEKADFEQHAPGWRFTPLPSYDNNTSHEFGINIDYASRMSHTTVSSDYEWAYLYYNTTPPSPQQNLTGVYDCDLAVKNLPDDIKNAQPIQALSGIAAMGAWESRRLYTNLCTGEVPAIIHHNGDKYARTFAWPSLWSAKHWKEIVTTLHEQNLQDPTVNDGGAVSDSGEAFHWEDLCQVWEEPVFEFELTHYPVPALRKGDPANLSDW